MAGLGNDVQIDAIIERIYLQLEEKHRADRAREEEVAQNNRNRFAASIPAWFGVFVSLGVAAWTFGIMQQKVDANTTDIERIERQDRIDSQTLSEINANVKVLMADMERRNSR